MSVAMTTIIDAQSLHARLNDPTVVIVDARFNLFNVDEGRASYLDGHVPGAVYAHLDDDLSGPPLTDAGRHPMPSPQALEALFSRLGVDAGSQVVAYDQRDGMLAARVWWMLRYMGHEAVAVLDGGWKAWTAPATGASKVSKHGPPAPFMARRAGIGWSAWTRSRQPRGWWIPGIRAVTVGKMSPWTRWPDTSPAPSIAFTARTWTARVVFSRQGSWPGASPSCWPVRLWRRRCSTVAPG